MEYLQGGWKNLHLLTMKSVIDPANPSVMQMGCRAFPRNRSMQLKLTFTQPQLRMKFQR